MAHQALNARHIISSGWECCNLRYRTFFNANKGGSSDIVCRTLPKLLAVLTCHPHSSKNSTLSDHGRKMFIGGWTSGKKTPLIRRTLVTDNLVQESPFYMQYGTRHMFEVVW